MNGPRQPEDLLEFVEQYKQVLLNAITEDLRNNSIGIPTAQKCAADFLAILPITSWVDFYGKVTKLAISYRTVQRANAILSIDSMEMDKMGLFLEQQNLYMQYVALRDTYTTELGNLQKRHQKEQSDLQSDFNQSKAQTEKAAATQIQKVNSSAASSDSIMKDLTGRVAASKFSSWTGSEGSISSPTSNINILSANDIERMISSMREKSSLVRHFIETGSNGAGLYVVGSLMALFGLIILSQSQTLAVVFILVAIPIFIGAIFQTIGTQSQRQDYISILQFNYEVQILKNKTIAELQKTRDQNISSINSRFNDNKATLTAKQKQEQSSFTSKYQQQFQALQKKFQEYIASAAILGTSWDSSEWELDANGTQPSQKWVGWMDASTAINTTRFGFLKLSSEIGNLAMPVFAKMPSGNILILSKGNQKDIASKVIRSIMFRLLVTQRAGKIQFSMFDPVGHGENIAAFMGLKEYDPELVSAKAWSDMRDIEQQLHQLVQNMDYVIQEDLRKDYNTIEEYNEQAGQMRLPYRILTVFDFPVNFTEDSARRLISLITNGPRCGICTIIMIDTQQPGIHGINFDDMKRYCQIVIDLQDSAAKIIVPDFSAAQLVVDTLPQQNHIKPFLDYIGKKALESKFFELPIEEILPLPKEYWESSTINGIKIPIGIYGAKKNQYVELVSSSTQVHALVAGQPGSGKTVMVHDLILSAALMYPPSELELFLIDMNEVGFAIYSEHLLPQARVIAVNSGREYGLSVIQGLVKLMHTRQKIFRGVLRNIDTPEVFSEMFERSDLYSDGFGNEQELEENNPVDEITKYRETYPNARMPRILLIIDEFQELFRDNDAIATAARSYLDELTKLGRKFGIHLLLITQTLRGIQGLNEGTLSQIAVRIAFRTTEADSRHILEDNPAASQIPSSSKGRGIYNPESGKKGADVHFQAANSTLEERARIADLAQSLSKLHNQESMRGEQIIFNGDAFANIVKHKQLNSLFEQQQWPPYTAKPTIWLGEPLAIKVPTHITLAPQSGSNILIVTEHEQRALAMFYSVVYSLCASYSPDKVRMSILDFNQTDSDMSQHFVLLQQKLPYTIAIIRRKDLEQFIIETHTHIQQTQSSEKPTSQIVPHYIFVFGIHNARDIYQDSLSELGEKFSSIVRMGPEIGIHLVTWCDRASQIRRTLGRLISEFDNRIVFPQPTSDDSQELIYSRGASVGILRDHRAILWYSGQTEEFCPFSLGSFERWSEKTNQVLQDRTHQR